MTPTSAPTSSSSQWTATLYSLRSRRTPPTTSSHVMLARSDHSRHTGASGVTPFLRNEVLQCRPPMSCGSTLPPARKHSRRRPFFRLGPSPALPSTPSAKPFIPTTNTSPMQTLPQVSRSLPSSISPTDT
ncbi:hypothetical protein C8F01DRAFT_1032297, partial [Mycena amicta]